MSAEKRVADLEAVVKQLAASTLELKKAEAEHNKELSITEKRELTRTKQITNTINALEKQGKEFLVLSLSFKKMRDTYKAFINEGGNAAEFFDAALSSTNQKVKIFGFEAASARKVMYGFLPPGMFRAVNKLSTGFRLAGSAIKQMGDSGEESNNIFTTLGKGIRKIVPDFTALKKMEEGRKEHLALAERNITFDPASKRYKEGGRFVSSKLGKAHEKAAGKAVRARRAQVREVGHQMTGNLFRGGKSQIKGVLKDPKTMPIFKFFSKMKTVLPAIVLYFKSKALGDIKTAGKGLLKFVGKMFVMLMRFTLYFTLVVTGLFLAFQLLKEPVKEAFKMVSGVLGFAIEVISAGFMTIWEGVSEIYQGFKDGDFFGVLMGVWTIVWGLLQITFGILLGALGILGALAIGFVVGLWKGAKGFFTGIFDKSQKSIGKIFLVVAAIFGLIFGWPVLLGALIVAAIAALLKKINVFGDGGVSDGGLSVVGDRGPELVRLPRNSRVHSNTESKRMVKSSSGGNTFNITINAKDTSDQELRRIADKIGKMINNKVNRRTTSGTMG